MAEKWMPSDLLLPDDVLLVKSALPMNLNSLKLIRDMKRRRADEVYEVTLASDLDHELIKPSDRVGSLTLLMSLNDFMGAMDRAMMQDIEIPLYWCGTDLRPERYKAILTDSPCLDGDKVEELLTCFRWVAKDLPFTALKSGNRRLVVDASMRLAEVDAWDIIDLASTCQVIVIGFTAQHNRESRYASWMPSEAMLLLAHCAQRLGYCFTGNYALTHHMLWIKHPDQTLVATDFPSRVTLYGNTDDESLTEVGGWC